MFRKEKWGFLGSGGGIAGAYIAGVCAEFYNAGITADRFTKVSVTSVSSLIVPSYLTGSIRDQLRLWTDGHLKRLLNWRHPFRPLDLHYLMHVAKDICPLNICELRRLPMPMEVTVTCCETGESLLVDLRAVDDPHRFMIASAALPQFHSPVRVVIDGVARFVADGGMSRELPIRRMMRDVDKVVVVLACPKDHRAKPMALPWKLLACPCPWKHPSLRATIGRRHEYANEAMDMIRNLEQQGRAIIVAPKRSLFDWRGRRCFRWKLDTKQDGINRAIALGREDAKHAIATLSLAA